MDILLISLLVLGLQGDLNFPPRADSVPDSPRTVASRPSVIPAHPQGTAPRPLSGNPDSAVAVLHAQLEERRESDDRLLATVHWSLGTIAAVSILLLGFGWWTNFRVYERDKAALRQDLAASLTDSFARLQATNQDEFSRLRALAQEEMLRFHNDTRAEVDALRRSIEPRFQTLRDEVVSAIDSKLAAHALQSTSDIAGLKAGLIAVSIRNAEADLDKWAEKEVWDNAIMAALTLISLARQSNEDWRVTRALEAITRFVNAGGGADSFTYGDIIRRLDQLPESHSLDVSNIKRALQENRAKRG